MERLLNEDISTNRILCSHYKVEFGNVQKRKFIETENRLFEETRGLGGKWGVTAKGYRAFLRVRKMF